MLNVLEFRLNADSVFVLKNIFFNLIKV